MSQDSDRKTPFITSMDQLVAWFREGEKQANECRVGTEHESVPYRLHDLGPVPYVDGIRELLRDLIPLGWEPVPDAAQPVALKRSQASVTLEPGGQVELSGAPLSTVHETAEELHAYLSDLLKVGKRHDIGFLQLGFRPQHTAEDSEWMPRERHRLMRHYLPSKGHLAHDMMLLTATIQANFDYCSEEDMARKVRTAMAISPLVAAMFAHSPYRHGVFSGFRSARYATWFDVDDDRCGMIPAVFESSFGYRDYIDYAMKVPMMFLRREGKYLDPKGMTFEQFLNDGFEGERATLADFENQLSGLFPEVRLKQFMEVRSADMAPTPFVLALPAFWKGILYDDKALDAAWALVAEMSFEHRVAMQRQIAMDGLEARTPAWNARQLCRALLDISEKGLSRQAALDASGRDETIFLAPLHDAVTSKVAPADSMVERYGSEPTGWRQFFKEFSLGAE